MSKRNWDGKFETSKFKETGNPELNKIVNNGRFVHEPTIDGYTHEMVDRGEFITDDYYFPDEQKAGKHHHYELRHYGPRMEARIDGKIIGRRENSAEDMRKGMVRKRSRGLDGTVLNTKKELEQELDSKIQEGNEIKEYGSSLESDKNKLESEIDKVKSSDLKEETKKSLINELNAAIREIQETYEKEVAEEMEAVQEEIAELIEDAQEQIEEHEEEISSLQEVEQFVANTEISSMIDDIENNKKEYENLKSEYTEKKNTQLEESSSQRQRIMSRRN